MLATKLISLLVFCAKISAQPRTVPPDAAVIVRGSGTQTGEFHTIQAAVASLPGDSSAQVIFVYPGTYTEQVHLTRAGNLTMMGYTESTKSYTANTVRLSFNLSQEQVGGGDLAATLRIDANNFSLYNIDVVNTFGPHNATGAQALAVAGYGTNLGFSAVGFYGYQDTLRAEKGVQFYGLCYIEGAVDFIFGQHGHAFFHRNTIASVGPGAITADGPDTSDESLFVINESNITTSAAATTDLTGQVFLGRPWSAQAQVAYISCWLDTLINSAGWEPWSASMPQTDGVLFAEYASTGPGAVGPRAPFATQLASPIGYGIAEVLGANWGAWVDAAYYI
ncbi:carbohydrate esterase family 8 protein [Mycena rosella]|uniref:Pectinesterase n=1 Tax=Mycena rosella TaxID=1033263 RepID=A0AAD7DAW7_MYCRO|nr:carbohydrate esterase family 8 protein [Mycena rosella]